MDLISLIRVAGEALLRNKSRSFLTILGIVIGVAAVIMLMAIGDGLKKYVSGRFEGLGTNIVTVFPLNLFDDRGNPQAQFGSPPVGGKTFTDRDVREIRRLDPSIIASIPIQSPFLKVKASNKQKTVNVTGSVVEYRFVRSINMSNGRFYSDGDVARAKKVAVLGPTIAQDLFPDKNPLGKTITISSVFFEVIGVTDPRGAGGGLGIADLDNQIYIPISSLQKLVDSKNIELIIIKVRNGQEIPKVINDVKSYLKPVSKFGQNLRI